MFVGCGGFDGGGGDGLVVVAVGVTAFLKVTVGIVVGAL